MMSAMSVAMLLMLLPSRIGGSEATFPTWHQRFASAINRLMSAVLGSLVLSLSLWFRADLHEMRTSRIQDCDPFLVPIKGTGGHYRSGSVDGPSTLSGYSLNVFVTFCGWHFETCRTHLGCKIICSEERARCLL